MSLYWAIFAYPAWMALVAEERRSARASYRGSVYLWWFLAAILVSTIGFRYQVGADWENYLGILYLANWKTLADVILEGDPAYGLLNIVGTEWGGIYLVNVVSAGLFTLGLLTFCRQQPRPWLATLVAIPYLVIVVAMGYTRQGIAIGLAMMALAALNDGKIVRYLLWLAFAATFHKSAVILIPLAIFPRAKKFLFRLALGLGTFALLYVLLVQEQLDSLIENYIEAEYASGGAAIRVAMNAIPALLFLLFRRRFGLTAEQRAFWTLMALGGLGFVVLLQVSPSSTAVDRIALYWIPLQMFVLARLPDVFARSRIELEAWTIALVAYSAAILFVWMSYSTHSFAWLPYRFAPIDARNFWT